ncbi:Hypothetical predicted protein [Paramuricea clavata]|uniref:Uncharacterized protein n=1 Tax=Paramuricea clavata TaxID=317549 RepID=A0A6S7FYN9_PARCT|nr:Hypothetical predicted protein [Paramuricea clavata]
MKKRMMRAFLLVFIVCATEAQEGGSGFFTRPPITIPPAPTTDEPAPTLPPGPTNPQPTQKTEQPKSGGCEYGNCQPKGDCDCLKGQKGSRACKINILH